MRLTKASQQGMFKGFVIAALSTQMMACSQMTASFQASPGLISKEAGTVIEDELSCVVDAADYTITTDVLSFQMTSSAGASVGFNLLSGLLKAIGISFDSATGQLDLAMHVHDPLKSTVALVDTTGTAKSSKIKFGVDFSLAMLAASANYYYQTPVAALSNNALKNSLENAKAKLAAVQNDWGTRVYKVIDQNQVLVHVGKNAALRVGDSFDIYQTAYDWTGASCNSTLLMARKVSMSPIATGTVSQIDSNSAVLVISNASAKIIRGDMVSVKALPIAKGESARALSRSVHLTTVATSNLVFDNNGVSQKVDLSPYVTQQLSNLVTSYGFYSF
ncbi:hypothetical protein BH10BDE1_BH10BDE1_09430 [soil metagenome]